MTDLADRLAEHRRLVILRCLVEAPDDRLRRDLLRVVLAAGGAANLSLIVDGLSDLGHPVTRDQARTVAAWLADQGLVVTGRAGDVDGVQLREAGAEVAEGRRLVPGIAPPATVDWLTRRLNALFVTAAVRDVEDGLSWLLAAGLVACDGEARVFHATRRGADVAHGREVVEGVKRPSFDSIMRAASNAARGILGG